MTPSYMNWSGGKDSAIALHKVLEAGTYDVRYLLTSVNRVHDRVSMHGVKRSLLEAQALSVGIPLKTIDLNEQPGMQEYEEGVFAVVEQLKKAGCTHSIFGDIFLEDLREYREKKLREQNITCCFPLWKSSTTQLVREFIELGFKSIIVCVNEKFLDKSFCGRLIDDSFLQDLPANVDPCGENGEFHSFVFEAPILKESIPIQKGEIVYRKYPAPQSSDTCFAGAPPSPYGFYFCDLLLPNEL